MGTKNKNKKARANRGSLRADACEEPRLRLIRGGKGAESGGATDDGDGRGGGGGGVRTRGIPHERVYDVTCCDPGKYRDLREEVGSLIVEYDEKGKPTMAMFEPLDDGVENLDMEVRSVSISGGVIAIDEADDGWFRFEVIRDELDDG